MTKLLSGLFASLMLCAAIGCGGDTTPPASPETPDASAAEDGGAEGGGADDSGADTGEMVK